MAIRSYNQTFGCWKAKPKEMVLLSRSYRLQVVLRKRQIPQAAPWGSWQQQSGNHEGEHRLFLNRVSEPVLRLLHWQGRERDIPHWFYILRHIFLLLEVAKGKIHITSEMPLTETGL